MAAPSVEADDIAGHRSAGINGADRQLKHASGASDEGHHPANWEKSGQPV